MPLKDSKNKLLFA